MVKEARKRMKKDSYKLPDDQCERVNRSEMIALRWSFAAINSIAYAKDDLKNRLKMIPNGVTRWNLMLGQLRSLLNDIVGTVPRKQCKTIKNVMDDMELRMVPKFTPKDHRINMDVEDLSYLVNHAKKDICIGCTMSGDECKDCNLYRILEAVAPPEDWGNNYSCPYSREDWFER